MARLQGISGGLSGKTGSYTFRQSRGETIVSQYQPVVKNPNTQGQQTQRAKFKLMSQLAAIMAPSFGTMDVTKRPGKQAPTQRNAFVQLNMPLVEVDGSADNEVIAKIPMDQVKLTSSFREELGMVICSKADNGLRVQIPVKAGSKVKNGKIALVGFGTMGVTKRASLVSMADVPVNETPVGDKAIEYTFTNIEPGDYTVLAFGLIPSESSSIKVDLDNIHTPDDEDFISAVQLNTLVANGTIVETATVGSNFTLTD